jgi:pseudouridine-5'-phosphate glycosidase
MPQPVALSAPLCRALSEGMPAVALETAVLTHGLPRPLNWDAYRQVLAVVRGEGVVPAPVAVVGGELRVGVEEGALEQLASGPGVRKAGLADLPVCAALGCDAGTTVASTLWAASAAGIPVFATGGIGGVHRGAEHTFDVSGDLAALARFGGCVVSSGAKVVLDLPKTVEVLETLGICVVGYRTDDFPAFLCVESGLRLAHRVDTPEGAAEVVRGRDRLGLPQAVLLVNPPPTEHALDRAELEEAVSRALQSAQRKELSGPGVTPFLLGAVASASRGASLSANRALLVENARLGARVARALSQIG